MAYNLNGKEFLKFYMNKINKYGVNRNGIKSLRFNKKSISVTIDKEFRNFFFNDFFTENHLFNELITYLSIYIKENNINCFNTYGVVYDIDYLNYIFENGLNVNYK